MKKFLSVFMIFALALVIAIPVFAADGYSFDLQYTGTVTKNVEKDANVLLIGVNAPVYQNVRIKVDIEGPATPKIMATDSLGNEIDIAQEGYWGPDAGFPVGGDFTNTTPIKATFIEEGSYTITLSLINVGDNNNVITSRVFTVEVFEDAPAVNNTVNDIVSNNNVIGNNVIAELPKTGTSVVEYAMYIIAITLVISVVGIYINRKRMNA